MLGGLRGGLNFGFEQPWWLLLLLLVPVLAWDFWRNATPTSPLKRHVLTWTRVVTAICLIFALAGLVYYGGRHGTQVLILYDQSDSVLPARQPALDWIERAAKGGPGHEAGLIVFGHDALVEQSPVSDLQVSSIHSRVDTSATDIEAALRLALALTTPGTPTRVVLVSDGAETSGRAERVLPEFRRLGIPIDVYPLTVGLSQEVILERLLAPARVARSEIFSAKVVVSSTHGTAATVRLFRNKELIAERAIQLQPGRNLFEFTGLREAGDFSVYEAQVETGSDTFPQNNTAATLVAAERSTRFLLLTDDMIASRPLVSALRAQGLTIDVLPTAAAPAQAQELERYSGVILQDVSALNLSQRQMVELGRYVRDLGGGLVAIGGRRSFGLGGYLQTPLEEALPVAMDSPNQMVIPNLALVLVLDRSGSMTETQGGRHSKLDLAKEAALGVLDVLRDRDLVGVLSFESDYSWTVPIQYAADRQAFANEIAQLRSEGGTDMGPALQEAGRALSRVRAVVKHIIVMSDGRSTEANFRAIARQIAEQKITVSTVAIGTDADRELLAQLAQWGGGRYYYTEDIRAIPQIFLTEALVVSRALAIEQTFRPRPGQSAEFLAGLDPASLPMLTGHLVTTPKMTAAVHLYATEEYPLLASWRYGLGRSVAFTSSASSLWANSWLSWPRFGPLWAQVLRWVMRPEGTQGLSVDVELQGGKGEVVVNAVDESGAYVNFLRLVAHVMGPSGETETVLLNQTAPGRYTGSFSASDQGAYVLAVADPNHARFQVPHVTGGVVPYSAEYQLTADAGLLRRLAKETGGRVLSGTENLFIPTRGNRVARPLWVPLAALALLLFFADICMRYLPAESSTALKRVTTQTAGRLSQRIHRIRRSLQDEAKRTNLADVLSRREQTLKAQAPDPEAARRYLARRRRNPPRPTDDREDPSA